MKKLLPLAAMALLATACSYDRDGHMRWGWNDMHGYCDHACCHRGEPLSERSLGNSRGWDNAPIEYSDADFTNGYYHHHCDMMDHNQATYVAPDGTVQPVQPVHHHHMHHMAK